MKTILIILSMAVLAAQPAVIQSTDLIQDSRTTINNNFALLDAKIIRMSGTPQANAVPCSSSANLGTIYLNINAAAPAQTLYICERRGIFDYSWAGPYATSASGGINWRGPWRDIDTYAIQDAVESGGSSYVAIAAHTNSAPPSAFWQLLASAGSSGGSCSALSTGATATSPADATTYYFGSISPWVLRTVGGQVRQYFPRSGTVTYGLVTFVQAGSNGTAENSSVYVRINNTTDYLISSSVVNNATTTSIGGSLSIPVTTSDYFEIKWVTPTWATNPTSVYSSATICF